jgi:subfamily B ATP-binding cassette protein MsbA
VNRRFLLQHVLKPYRWPLAFAFLAMLFETLADLAEPWPLKIVLDSVIGHHPLPRALAGLHDLFGRHQGGTIAVAALATVAIALVGSVASYFDSYLTTSVGQYIAHDLRRKVYHHLQRLSLSYYDHHKIGDILSTITDDIDNVQSFFSASVLSIAIDVATIIGMFVVMLYLDWKFTLIAMAVTPFLFLFVQRFTRLVKQSTKAVRAKESEIVSTVEESLGAIRVIKAFAQGQIEEEKLAKRSEESVEAALQARRIKAFLSPVMDLVAAIGTALVLWYGASLVLSNQMTAGSLVVFLLYLGKMFKPMEDLAKMTNSASKAAVGWTGSRRSSTATRCSRRGRTRARRRSWRATSPSSTSRSATSPTSSSSPTCTSTSPPARWARSWARPVRASPRSSTWSRACTIRREAR